MSITGVRPEHRMCRLMNHRFDFFKDPNWNHSFGIPMSWECNQCGTVRHDLVGGGGAVLSRHYVYPEGYLLPKGQAPTRSELREWFATEMV